MTDEQSKPKKGILGQMAQGLGWTVLILVSLIVGAFVMDPRIIPGGHPRSEHVDAIQGVKRLGYALFNFEGEYGVYPNEETAELLKQKFPEQAHLLKTESSNDFLMQLLVAGHLEDEDFRFNGDTKPIKEHLQSDEFPFAYVVGLNSSYNSSRALLLGPLQEGKFEADEDFARKHYKKRSVVLRIDLSVTDPKMDKRFFDLTNNYWGGEKPRIAWPK